MDCVNLPLRGTCVVVGHGLISSPLLVSAVVITAWDPETRIGGMTHLVTPALPGFKIENSQSASNPVQELILEMAVAGASASRLQTAIVGGAAPLTKGAKLDERFRIGERLVNQALGVLRECGLIPVFQEVGGCVGRQCVLDVKTGLVRVLSQNDNEVVLVAATSPSKGKKE